MSIKEIENYSYIRCLGNGTYGDVKLYRDIRTKQKVVIKTIKLLTNNLSIHDVAKEIMIMSKLDHPRVIRFLSCFEDSVGQKLNIVMEYASGGTLHGLIEQQKAEGVFFEQEVILRLFCELLMGIDYLHMRHVIHCDLKPENVLLDSSMRVKIGDFGISFVTSDPSKAVEASYFGTPIYMAPEVYTMRSYSSLSDVWALGVILYEMCTLKPPFGGTTIEQLTKDIHRGKFEPIPCKTLGYDMNFQVIVKLMIQPKLKDRCSLSGIIAHPFITKSFYETFFS
ncbi:serine/threonine-protein kinase Nek3 [Phlebotomus papatasi]|uniref:serine/threonine-protein kinase Nek3 n=1 Tax=Phlebotomus papatasi TaxID=29031 RepID=UPI0024847355|nr:serine/threonine-protein kinase Nek3 [Phlebotomus papatasi]